MRYAKKIVILGVLFPVLSFAQAELGDILDTGRSLIDIAIRIAFGLAIAAFFFGFARYLFGGTKDKVLGKTVMVWGTLAICVMLSVLGIVGFLQRSIGMENGSGSAINAPQIECRGSACAP